MDLFNDIDAGAEFSENRRYRFALWRIWDKSKPLVMFIGLNPSTANETEVDPTIRSVIRISKFNGYGGFYMMNCFPMVTADPKELMIDKTTQKENDTWLKLISRRCADVVFAWGHFNYVKEEKRDKELATMFPDAVVLGHNSDGSPKHPLFTKAATKFVSYSNHTVK